MFAGYRHCKKCGKALMGLFDGALCEECEKEENSRMTNEEAIANINMIRVAFVDPVTKEQRKLIDDTLDTAIKALEQQPCDAISREAALEKMADYVASGYADSAEDFEEYSRIICQLPPVTQKYGKWIRVTDKTGHLVWECDKCSWQQRLNTNFCPDCGARMDEPQERSDKE